MGFIIQTAVLAKAQRRKGAKWWDLIFKDHKSTAKVSRRAAAKKQS
jgi:hypothetical protein